MKNRYYMEILTFAAMAHDGQYRKDGFTPYIVHPIEVERIVSSLDSCTEMMSTVALLHDVIEDTNFDYDAIARNFGRTVAYMVLQLTNDKESVRVVGKTPYLIDKMVNILSTDCLTIKLADRLANVKDLGDMVGTKNEEFARKTAEATFNILEALVENRELNADQKYLVDQIYTSLKWYKK